MNKVYVIEGSTGTWDDYRYLTLGIFTTMWDAEKAREQILIDREKVVNKYTEEESDKFRQKSIEYIGKKYPEDLADWWEWFHDTVKLNEQVTIKEYKLNEIISITG